jgi:hypothetical protein
MLSCPFCNMNVTSLDDNGFHDCGYPFDIGSVVLFDWSDYGDGYAGI